MGEVEAEWAAEQRGWERKEVGGAVKEERAMVVGAVAAERVGMVEVGLVAVLAVMMGSEEMTVALVGTGEGEVKVVVALVEAAKAVAGMVAGEKVARVAAAAAGMEMAAAAAAVMEMEAEETCSCLLARSGTRTLECSSSRRRSRYQWKRAYTHSLRCHRNCWAHLPPIPYKLPPRTWLRSKRQYHHSIAKCPQHCCPTHQSMHPQHWLLVALSARAHSARQTLS